MNALIQPQLDKWSLSTDISFSQAADIASANVVIEFEKKFDVWGQDVPEDDGAGAAAQYGNYTGNKLLNAEIGLWPSPHWAGDLNDFAWTVLHEWGHVLGLADLYSVDHGDGTYELEDFIDHGLPSTDPLNTGGKQDNVMQTIGSCNSTTMKWLEHSGCGVRSARFAGHGRAKGPRQRVQCHQDRRSPRSEHMAIPGHFECGALRPGEHSYPVRCRSNRRTGCRSGRLDKNILADRVIFTSALGDAGNFELEIDSPLREGYIRATIADNTPTDFSQIPLANGRQLAPMVFGPVRSRNQAACC